MKHTLIGICLLLIACGRSELASDEIYGAQHEAADVIPVEAVLAEPQYYTDNEIAVAGTVHEVCQMEGCWLMLRGLDTGEGLRVHVERTETDEYVFTVPTDISGRYAVAVGTLTIPEVEEEAHYQEDAPGAAPMLSMVATGVRISPEESI
jgi:hypothetical protein